MNYKNPYSILLFITGGMLVIYSFVLILNATTLSKRLMLFRFPLILCFLSHSVFFIIYGIINRDDHDSYYKRLYNIIVISIVLLFFATAMVFEFFEKDYLSFMIKPFSDLFGYIFIENEISKILNDGLKPINSQNAYKVYNNWMYYVNRFKFRTTKIDNVIQSSFDFNSTLDIESYMKRFIGESNKPFIHLLNLKDDIGYTFWMLIIIIVLYNIS